MGTRVVTLRDHLSARGRGQPWHAYRDIARAEPVWPRRADATQISASRAGNAHWTPSVSHCHCDRGALKEAHCRGQPWLAYRYAARAEPVPSGRAFNRPCIQQAMPSTGRAFNSTCLTNTQSHPHTTHAQHESVHAMMMRAVQNPHTQLVH